MAFNTAPIDSSYSTATVVGRLAVGGLAGNNDNGGIITSGYSSGIVKGDGAGSRRIGGLVGECYDTVSGSLSTVDILGGFMIGDLVGSNLTNSRIISSYSAGAVLGHSRVGGLAGSIGNESSTTGSYAFGPVLGSSEIGELEGNNQNPRRHHRKLLEPRSFRPGCLRKQRLDFRLRTPLAH